MYRIGAFSILDVIDWHVVVAAAAARFIAITRFQGRPASREPATLEYFRRFARVPFAVAAAAWVLAHGLRIWVPRRT